MAVPWPRASGFLDSRVRSPDYSMVDEPNVAALVDRVVARDQAAFAELYDLLLHHPGR
jgi:hypothetical protein